MTLHAAFAVVDVTPEVGGPLVGYGDSGRSTGVLAPIEAVVALLSSPDGEAVIVALDVVGLGFGVSDRLRRALASATGVPRAAVLQSATHNHAGPNWWDEDRAQVADADRMIARVAAAARGLRHRLRPVTPHLAVGRTGIAENRRETTPDGRARMGRNPDGPVDRRVGVLDLRDADGRSVGTLVTAAAHSNCLTGANTCLAPDFAGRARQAVSEATGAPVLFVQGAAGDLNPVRRGSWEDAVAIGEALAADVLTARATAVPTAATVRATSVPLDLRTVPLPGPERAAELAATAHREWELPVDAWLAWLEAARERGEVDGVALPAEMTVIRVGDLTVGGAPYELFCEIALDAAERLGSSAFLCGYVNGYYGYLPTAEAFALGGYEVEWMPIVHGISTGLPLPPHPSSADQVVAAFVRAAR